MTADEVLKRFRRMILELFPEFGGTHLPLKGQVTKVNGEAGTVKVAGGTRRYSVDIKPLHPDGSEDKSRPRLKDVPLDVPWAGDKRGVFALPKVGAIVRVGFYGGSAAHPYIDGVLPDGSAVPAVEQGQYLIQLNDQMSILLEAEGATIKLKDAGAKLKVEAAGDVEVQTDMNATVKAKLNATVDAQVNATVKAGAKAHIDAPQVDLGKVGIFPVAHVTSMGTCAVGPVIVTTGSGTTKTNP